MYTERFTRHEAARDAAKRRSVRLSNLRAATFLAAAAAFIAFDFLEPPAEWIALAVGGLLTVVFVGQVIVHRGVRRKERWKGA